MRVLFESARVPVEVTMPDDAGTRIDGKTARGTAWLAVRVFESGETIPNEFSHARPVARVLAVLPADGPHRSTMPPAFKPLSGEERHVVLVPRAVLTSVPPETIVGIDWEFTAECGQPLAPC